MNKVIDWPESAQYFCDGAFYRCDSGKWWILWPQETKWDKTPYASPENFSWWGKVIIRPIPWSGEGLPPVGTICEFRFSASDDWNVVEVKYMSEMTALLFHHGETGDAEGAYCPKSCVFRPIKTAEQIEVENKKQAIIQICLDAGSAELTPGQMAVAEKLYDAGYRKVSK